jgi:hypothetical protein
MNKKLLYGLLGVGAFSFVVYKYLKNKRAERSSGFESNEDVEFSNVNGNIGDILNQQRQRIYISVSESKKQIQQATPENYKKFIGKKIYTLQDNVNIRNGANVNNGIFNNLSGTIPKKKSLIGKILVVKKSKDGYLWFGFDENNSNSKLSKYFNWDIKIMPDPSIKYVRSDVVVVESFKK